VKQKALIVGGVVIVLTMMLALGTAWAASNFKIVADYRDVNGDPGVEFSFYADTDDSGGLDVIAGVCTDDSGAVVDVDVRAGAVGTTVTDYVDCDPLPGTSYTEPVFIEIFDLDAAYPEDNSQADFFRTFPRVLIYSSVGYRAVRVPSGYVQYTITCDTPVYDAPGGSPVGENMITAGQTWYIDPAAEGDGAWTAVFVAGPHVGYIPTSCVGQPTEYSVPIE